MPWLSEPRLVALDDPVNVLARLVHLGQQQPSVVALEADRVARAARRREDRAVAAVTLDDCDHVMSVLPKTAEAPASRRHYAATAMPSRRAVCRCARPRSLPSPERSSPPGGAQAC